MKMRTGRAGARRSRKFGAMAPTGVFLLEERSCLKSDKDFSKRTSGAKAAKPNHAYSRPTVGDVSGITAIGGGLGCVMGCVME